MRRLNPEGNEVFGSSGVISAEGVLYIGNWDGNLYGISVGTEEIAKSGWPKFRGTVRNTGRFGEK